MLKRTTLITSSLVIAFTLTSVRPALAICTPHWHSLLTATSPPTKTLVAISVVDAEDAWAVGDVRTRSGQFRTLVERWDGVRWTIVPSPNPDPDSDYLNAVKAFASDDVWIAGTAGAGMATAHFDGVSWTVLPASGHDGFNDLDGASTNDLWAVGLYGVVEHWDGVQWNPVDTGSDHSYYGVSEESPTDIWAVGYDPAGESAKSWTSHFDGASWTHIQIPFAGHEPILEAVAAISPDDAWAVGEDLAGSPAHTYHWDGVTWTDEPFGTITQPTSLLDVAASSSSDVWSVGSQDLAPLARQWDGSSWSLTHTPGYANLLILYGLAIDSSTAVPWAIGGGGHPLALRYNDCT
jgi:hypothetical protein